MGRQGVWGVVSSRGQVPHGGGVDHRGFAGHSVAMSEKAMMLLNNIRRKKIRARVVGGVVERASQGAELSPVPSNQRMGRRQVVSHGSHKCETHSVAAPCPTPKTHARGGSDLQGQRGCRAKHVAFPQPNPALLLSTKARPESTPGSAEDLFWTVTTLFPRKGVHASLERAGRLVVAPERFNPRRPPSGLVHGHRGQTVCHAQVTVRTDTAQGSATTYSAAWTGCGSSLCVPGQKALCRGVLACGAASGAAWPPEGSGGCRRRGGWEGGGVDQASQGGGWRLAGTLGRRGCQGLRGVR